MSRTLLILALVALLFAGVVTAQSSSSSTGEESSSSVDFSSTAEGSSSSTAPEQSSTGPSSTGPSSTGPSSTGPSSTGPSSTGPSSTGPSSSSSGPNGTIIESSSSSTGPIVPAVNGSVIVYLTAESAFNQATQNLLTPVIASLLNITSSGAEWFPKAEGRRLLAVQNSVVYSNVPLAQVQTANSKLADSTGNAEFLTAVKAAAPNAGITAAGTTPDNGAASGLAASPLVLAAAAVLAMLF